MIRKFLTRRRKGAMAMVALAGMVPMTAMMSANLNTSQMVDDRRQMQDAADALAVMHGTWSARALNIISMNNVTAAQLLSVAVGSEALFMTTTELIASALAAQAAITAHSAAECTPRNKVEAALWSGPCAGYHEAVAFPAKLAFARASDMNSDFDPVHGIETARKALSAIDGMNRALSARHPRAMREISQDYYDLLDLDDHHFADPCNGPGVANCDRRNSRDGMALPIEAADTQTYGRLAVLMKIGANVSDTTFITRGFNRGRGPLSLGGSTRRRQLEQHINNITEIGNALYDMDRFYRSRISHMPKRPFSGIGNARPRFLGPRTPAYRGDRFVDRRRDIWDIVVPIMEQIEPFVRMGLGLARNVPLIQWDHHLGGNGYMIQRQQRTRSNSFFRNFLIAHGSIGVAPQARARVPIGFDWSSFSFVTPVEVPEIFQLEGIDGLVPLPPIEATAMPEAFHVLAFGQKEKARRLGEAVMSSSVTSHTGYGQAGVFNPDGATLFTQNWHSQLMPATRMDDPLLAGRDLDRDAPAAFDDLAQDLQQVLTTSSWERVHAH